MVLFLSIYEEIVYFSPSVIASEVQRNEAICHSLPSLPTKRSEVKESVKLELKTNRLLRLLHTCLSLCLAMTVIMSFAMTIQFESLFLTAKYFTHSIQPKNTNAYKMIVNVYL